MDKKTKIFFTLFFLLVIGAVFFSFYKYFIVRDYDVRLEADCDPAIESCFIYTCEPADDSECPENPEERVSYYKMIEKKASKIELCNPGEEGCEAGGCTRGDDCREIFCGEISSREEDGCMYPELYLELNPPLPVAETSDFMGIDTGVSSSASTVDAAVY